jgi:hypothetical protein
MPNVLEIRPVLADSMLHRRLSNLMMISVCVIVYDIQFGDETTRKRSTTYLGICCGTFGSLHLTDSSLPFEEILDLVKILRSPTNVQESNQTWG